MQHNELHFYCMVDKSASSAYRELEAYKAEMLRHYPCRFTIEEYDGASIEWDVRNNKAYASDKFVFKHTERIAAKHGTNVDSVKFFVGGRNWVNDDVRLLGFKLGRVFNGYYVTFTKYRRGYEDTAEHEDLHFIDEYVKVNTGVVFETLLNVQDFDSDIVHGDEYWRRGYNYDRIWERIGPHVSNAVFKRRNNEQNRIALLKQYIALLLQYIGLLKYQSNSIFELEIKEQHTTKRYPQPLIKANAIIGHIDLGTEAGTVNEILNGPRSGSYHWYIPRHGKYVIEFVPQNETAWHAGVLHKPEAATWELLGGVNRVIESGEPNYFAYGICYEGLTDNTEPTERQIKLAAELVKLKKIDQLPWFEHWRVTSYKPKVVTYFVKGVTDLLAKK